MSRFKTVALLSLTLLFHVCHAQNLESDRREILDLVKKWNYANNWKSVSTFRSIYHKNLVVHSQTLSRERCIALKLIFFKDHPEFKQKIISDPVLTQYTSGMIKCDFVKEAYQDGIWKKQPSYLLIRYDKNQYAIAGESDLQKNDLQINKTLRSNVEKKVAVDTPPMDTAPETDAIAKDATIYNDTITDIARELNDSTLMAEFYNEVLSEEAISIPKKYLYFLIGFLMLIAFIVLFSKHGNRKKNKSPVKTRGKNGSHHGANTIRGDKRFENFAVSLFDPHYFTVRAARYQPVYAGNGHGKDFYPDLEIEFKNKEITVGFVMVCLYIPKASSVYLFSGNQVKRYHDLYEAYGKDVYLLIGSGGEPDDPKELYLIRSLDLRMDKITWSDLQPFRKSGMVFYSSATARLR